MGKGLGPSAFELLYMHTTGLWIYIVINALCIKTGTRSPPTTALDPRLSGARTRS
jgi:hypothetical protein